MVFLQGVGVSTSLAVKIYKEYGDESVETVKREPYRRAADIWGSVSRPPTRSPRRSASRDSPERIRAGLAFTLSAAADDGHCYLPVRELVAEDVKILGVPQEAVAEQVSDLAVEEPAVCYKVPGDDGVTEAVYLPPFFHSERSVASSLTRLLVARDDRLAVFQSVDWAWALGWLRARTGPTSLLSRPTNALLPEALTLYREGAPERSYGGRCSAWVTKSPSSATTTTRARPGCSTAPSAL